MTENHIAAIVVDAALKIHKVLGPGLLESVYQATLSFELQKRGLSGFARKVVKKSARAGLRPSLRSLRISVISALNICRDDS